MYWINLIEINFLIPESISNLIARDMSIHFINVLIRNHTKAHHFYKSNITIIECLPRYWTTLKNAVQDFFSPQLFARSGFKSWVDNLRIIFILGNI